MILREDDFFDFSGVTGPLLEEVAQDSIKSFMLGHFRILEVRKVGSFIDFYFRKDEYPNRITFVFMFPFSKDDPTPYLSMSGGFDYPLSEQISKKELLEDMLIAVPELRSFQRTALSELFKGAEEGLKS